MELALSGSDTTLVLVTHDRAFLEALATGLLELDAGTAHQYAFGGAGCYDRYRQARPRPFAHTVDCCNAVRRLLRVEHT